MNNRRRIIMINRKFQLALIFKFLLVNILIMALFGVFLYTFLNSEVEANLYSAHVTYQNMKEMLFPIVLTLSILNLIISSAIIAIFVLYASFRIAGPLYRFNTAVKEISQGNLNPLLTLREKDELYAFSETLQDMTKNFAHLYQKSKSVVVELKEIDEKKDYSKVGPKVDELESILKLIKD